MPDTVAGQTERMEFQTEAKQLLHLVIHSLYSHKEIFIRELISNASDALDRLRFESVTDPSLRPNDEELAIRIKLDKNGKIFTISDNGIGMNRRELIENIGTIARSGSRLFLEKMTGDQKADSNMIGRFGVGFYSVFMAASRVKITTKRAGSTESALLWESDGVSEYTISETEKEGTGTEITVYLNEEDSSFAEPWQVRSIIKKYSDFIAFPIYLPNDKGADEVVNQTKPIWRRSASEITDEQYEEFYRQALGGFDKPLLWIHHRAEGVMEYSSLLFIPEKAPFELFNVERKHGIKLYVKRVFIMDDCKELIPEYLRFVKGVVDSEDLPLNVSRETLQHNPLIEKIRKAVVGRIFNRLTELSEQDPSRFTAFWKEFGVILKEGLHTDWENRQKLLEIIRFRSSLGGPGDFTSLRRYVDRMKTDQKDIYYITGESLDLVEKSPHLEVFREKGIEVLYLVDPIDEFIVNDIHDYESHNLRSIAKGDLDLGELAGEEKKEIKKVESRFKKLTERIKNILTEQVREVRVSARLKDSPACIVTGENDMSPHMEKIMKAMGRQMPSSKPVLEINPSHPVIVNLNALYDASPKDPQLEEWARLLFDQAVIAQGQMVRDPLAYSRRVNNLLSRASAELAGEGKKKE